MRSFSHIANEMFKMFPSLAGHNAATAIAWVAAIIGIKTAIPHIAPAAIERMLPEAMGALENRGHIYPKTTATPGMAAFQFTGRQKRNFPAIAPTFPYDEVTLPFFRWLKGYQATKTHAGYIEPWHAGIIS